MEKIILGVIDSHLKENVYTGQSQHGFMMGKSRFTKLISFYDKATCLMDAGEVMNVVFFYFGLERLLILSLTVSFWTKCPAHS